jgi:hypothetical protein
MNCGSVEQTRSNRMAYTKPVIEELMNQEIEKVASRVNSVSAYRKQMKLKPQNSVFFAFETIYVFMSTSRWPGSAYFWTATEEAWLEGDYEFERGD